jgi:site-specific DNA-methyltransferase (adenine-specific)
MELPINKIITGNCLEVMKNIDDKSIDMILCDLPYGTTACKWDTIIPFEPLWVCYKRIIKDNGAIVLTASQPFTTDVINSNRKNFKYLWVWNKKLSGSFQNAKYQPLRITEDVVVFGNKINYYPQMRKGKPRYKGHREKSDNSNSNVCNGLRKNADYVFYDSYFPVNIIEIGNTDKRSLVHPTQKPVALFEYLIKTYTNEGDLVLDNCIGSGTTAIAALRTGRNFIGIEKEQQYVDIANKRIEQETGQGSLF